MTGPRRAGLSRRFLVLHGWQNRRPREHWQWQLVEALRLGGEQVLYPQLPDPDRPSLDTWTELLHAELAQLGNGERVVVAHSLAVPLWLHAAPAVGRGERVDRVLLVSPPSPRVLAGHPEVEAFARVEQDPRAVAAAATCTRLVCSDNDPYCPEGAPSVYAALELDTDVIPVGSTSTRTPDTAPGRPRSTGAETRAPGSPRADLRVAAPHLAAGLPWTS